MSVAKCIKCGKNVNLEKKNCRETMHGEYAHVKCPGVVEAVLDDDERKQYRALTDRIKYHHENNAAGYVLTQGVNYKNLTPKIKQLKDDGYSYEDQIYALDKTVELQNGFIGYGSVVNNIVRIIAERGKQKDIVAKTEIGKTDEVKFKFDLGKNDDYEW